MAKSREQKRAEIAHELHTTAAIAEVTLGYSAMRNALCQALVEEGVEAKLRAAFPSDHPAIVMLEEWYEEKRADGWKQG